MFKVDMFKYVSQPYFLEWQTLKGIDGFKKKQRTSVMFEEFSTISLK